MIPPYSTIKQRLFEKGISGLALDIDETLSWTVGWWMTEMQKVFGNPENLSAKDMVKKYRYAKLVPYWKDLPEVQTWREKHRLDNEVQKILPLMDDALPSVLEIHKKIPILAYLTIRPESVNEGTKFWLEKHGFPKAEIISRPETVIFEDGNRWKAEVLEDLYPTVSGIIDDNAEVVEHLSQNYKGTIYLYNHDESPSSNVHVIPCPTWEEVVKNVQRIVPAL